MPHSEEQVERIVHAVLQRLNTSAQPAHGELALTDKVISAASLSNRLDGVQRIVITARAIITPAARDILKEKNITLARTLQPPKTGSIRLVIASGGSKAGDNFATISLPALLKQRGVQVEQLAAGEVGTVVSQLAETVGHGQKLGLLLTDQVAAALCAANRRCGVRAATATNRAELNDVMQNLGVNLLVVDIVRRSQSEIQRMAEVFATAPPQGCPVIWKTWLE